MTNKEEQENIENLKERIRKLEREKGKLSEELEKLLRRELCLS